MTFPGRTGPVVQTIDAVGTALVAAGTAAGPGAAVAALTAPATQASPVEEARARLKTYLQLAAQADRRNVAFLRTAWRNEKDPAVRAAVADAVYQSNPSDYLGTRALLDSFTASDDVYLRLRLLARTLGVETPCVSSLVTLAAEGNAEALSRLVELARASGQDEHAKSDLAVALAEVARTAPEELVHALQTAVPTDRDAALPLLAKGLEREADPDHPFWPAVRGLMGSTDAARASFASQLETELSQRIALDKAATLPPTAPSPAGGPEHPAGAPGRKAGRLAKGLSSRAGPCGKPALSRRPPEKPGASCQRPLLRAFLPPGRNGPVLERTVKRHGWRREQSHSGGQPGCGPRGALHSQWAGGCQLPHRHQ